MIKYKLLDNLSTMCFPNNLCYEKCEVIWVYFRCKKKNYQVHEYKNEKLFIKS
jgi:hypothetical protein